MDERGKVLPFPKPAIRVATCGCGGQTFILVCDDQEAPDFLYCTLCQHRQSRLRWGWDIENKPPEVST